MYNFLQSIKEKILFDRKPVFFVTVAALLVVFSFSFSRASAKNNPRQSWIRLTKEGFVKEGKPFKFIGANAVNLVFYDDWDLDIEKTIRTAKENNISVLRLYIDLGWGKDDDFDRIFDLASQNGIHIILAFTDCCCSSDYATLKKYFEVHAPFCNITNEHSRKAFKKLIKQIISRINSVNNRLYRDDHTILAWEIANELEYWRFSDSQVRQWIDEIAGYIKKLDKNHLVTIGISTNNLESINNEDLLKIFGSPALDFFSFHFYPSAETKVFNNDLLFENTQKINSITKRFLSLGKPVIMAEFGFSGSVELNEKTRADSETADFYISAFKEYMDTAFNAGCAGVMFWGWGIPEVKRVPMWWSREDHSIADQKFCDFIKNYRIPEGHGK